MSGATDGQVLTILLTGPLWLPVVAGKRVDFSGRVDAPFYSMDGWVGRRDIVNPSPPPPYITDTLTRSMRTAARIGAASSWSAASVAQPNSLRRLQPMPHGSRRSRLRRRDRGRFRS
jgi:hypothetical protein